MTGVLALSFLSIIPASAAEEWPTTLTRDSRGNFPDLRPGTAVYAFGWSGVVAATADVRFSRATAGEVTLEGKGRTIGLARALWRFDVNYRSTAHGDTLRPQQMHQDENVRGKRLLTDLAFSDEGVARTRTENRRAPTTKRFPGSDWHDLFSALLYLRSQPMREHNVYRLAVYPATSGYLATITVTGHEKIQTRTGSFDTIRLDVKVQRISKKGALEPYRKLKRATAWVSDDNDRMLLRVEGQILIGTVTAELQSLHFD